jgi:1-acyl-sn-glycerol-3-phosphate acyltransferase
LEISGREKFDKEKSYVFMPNHLSLLDGPLMFMLIPQKTSVIIKKEALKIPIIGLAMRLAKFVPVDRKGLRGGKESIEKAVQLMKKEGFSFLIFPEGTRSRNGKLQSFKRGGFFLAFSSQTPIVPVSIKGTYELQPKTTFFIKKGKVKVTFHEPISVEGCNVNSIPVLMDKVWNVVKKGLDSV